MRKDIARTNSYVEQELGHLSNTVESPRSRHIRETNERMRIDNMKSVWRRRHNKENRTTLKERVAWVNDMSNDGL